MRMRWTIINIIKLTVILNLISLVSFVLYGVLMRNIIHINKQNVLYTLPFSRESISIFTLSPLRIKKLAQMKRELNDSTLTNEAMFPANRIGRYLLLNPKLCTSVDHVNIIIIVHTATNNLENRQHIRDSFAQAALFRPFEIRVAFLLGKTNNKTLERILWLEHVRYNDTVMGDFIDDYHNLTLKGVMGFRWVSQYCSNSDFVLKIDDDVLVNMYKLLYSFLNHMSGKKRSIFCNFWRNNTMPILREGKWKVNSHIYSSRKTFPYVYCSGFIVILTSDLIKPLYQAALTTPFFWIDDVYLFGMLPSVVGDVTYYNYALNKNVTLSEHIAKNCTLSLGTRCPIFATGVYRQTYWSLWAIITDIYSAKNWTVESKIIH